MGGSIGPRSATSSSRIGVACIACGRPLRSFTGSYPLVFRCEGAHFFTLEDVLDQLPPSIVSGREILPETTLALWKGHADLFHELSCEALWNGHPFAAADFKDAGNRIDTWVARLGALLTKHLPGALLKGRN